MAGTAASCRWVDPNQTTDERGEKEIDVHDQSTSSAICLPCFKWQATGQVALSKLAMARRPKRSSESADVRMSQRATSTGQSAVCLVQIVLA